MKSNIKPDIIASVELFSTDKGGRGSATPEEYFGCPLKFEGVENLFDCRLLLYEIGQISPGETKKVPIKFLDSEGVLTFLKIGTSFKLWEGKIIGEGFVVEILL